MTQVPPSVSQLGQILVLYRTEVDWEEGKRRESSCKEADVMSSHSCSLALQSVTNEQAATASKKSRERTVGEFCTLVMNSKVELTKT